MRTTSLMSLVTALAGLAVVPAARAAEPCGGIRGSEGTLVLGDRLTLDRANSPEGADCLLAIATELLKHPSLQTVTVAARVPNDQGMREKGMETANFVADRLAEHGVEQSLISTVVPFGRPDEKDAIQVSFVERGSSRSVAQLQTVSGRVFAGHQLGQLRDATPGVLLTGSDYLETGKGSVALLKLLDGTQLYLFENSALKVGKVDVDATKGRDVQVHLLHGEVAVMAANRLGPLYLVTGNAIAGVRGTIFRITQPEPQKSRVEALVGTVTFGGKNGNLFVAEGKGSRVDYKGVPEEPRPLLISALPERPLMGRALAGDVLKWQPVSEAARYRVDLAQNAQFTRSWIGLETIQAKILVPDTLGPGKWFWRVTAIDVDGFAGYPSKIYAFVVPDAR